MRIFHCPDMASTTFVGPYWDMLGRDYGHLVHLARKTALKSTQTPDPFRSVSAMRTKLSFVAAEQISALAGLCYPILFFEKSI